MKRSVIAELFEVSLDSLAGPQAGAQRSELTYLLRVTAGVHPSGVSAGVGDRESHFANC